MKTVLALILSLILSSCASPSLKVENPAGEMKPGLGEIMEVIQQHHAKLYFSGSSQNWELAEYQIDEIKEGIEDVVKYYPTFKEVKLPLKDLIPRIIESPLKSVADAIHKKSKAEFIRAFNGLTASCNSCHQAANHGFIVIQAPKSPEFTNQKFTP